MYTLLKVNIHWINLDSIQASICLYLHHLTIISIYEYKISKTLSKINDSPKMQMESMQILICLEVI
jgi:hypothetical protein